MNFLEFLFNTLALLVGGFVVLGVGVTIWNFTKLEEENKKLKEELLKKEYKKVSRVRTTKKEREEK